MTERMTDEAERLPAEGSETRQRELRTIFVDATGSEEFTETQEQEVTSRYIDAENSLSGSVTAIAKADGLTDTLADPDYENDPG